MKLKFLHETYSAQLAIAPDNHPTIKRGSSPDEFSTLPVDDQAELATFRLLADGTLTVFGAASKNEYIRFTGRLIAIDLKLTTC